MSRQKTTSLFRRRSRGPRPRSAVVARARVGRRITFLSGDARTIEVTAGQAVSLKFAYTFEETSRNRETFDFELRSRIESLRAPPAAVQHVDRWLLPDAGGGYVEQQYVIDRPGEYELDFEVLASYSSRDWSKRSLVRKADGTRSGSVRVVVRPAKD